MTNRFLPRASAALTNAAGPPTAEWRRFFESLAAQTDNVSLQAEYLALAARVAALEDDPGADIGLVLGQQSIKQVGVLTSGNVYLTLQGDAQTPGNSYYYGTDAAGAKGWHALSLDALSDVDLTTTPPADGDVLTYDNATSTWIPAAGGGGVTDFTDLGDVPASYTGEAGKLVAVKATEDGLEFIAPSSGSAAAGYAAMRIKAGGFRSIQDFGGTPTAIAVTSNRIYAQPFTVDREVDIIELALEVSTLSVGNKARAGIYSNTVVSGLSQPDALLIETADMSTTTTGFKNSAAVITLSPGVVYWAASLCNIGAGFRAYPFAEFPIQWFGRPTTLSNNPNNHLGYAVGSGWTAMPATWSGGYAVASSNVPAVFLVE